MIQCAFSDFATLLSKGYIPPPKVWPLSYFVWGSNVFMLCLWYVYKFGIIKQSVASVSKDAILKLIFPWHLPSSTEEKHTEKIMLRKKKENYKKIHKKVPLGWKWKNFVLLVLSRFFSYKVYFWPFLKVCPCDRKSPMGCLHLTKGR